MAGLAASSLRGAAGRCGAREVTPRAWEGRAGRGEADERVIKDREWPGRWVRAAAAVELRRGRKRERKGERGREEVQRIPHLAANLTTVSFSAGTQRAWRTAAGRAPWCGNGGACTGTRGRATAAPPRVGEGCGAQG